MKVKITNHEGIAPSLFGKKLKLTGLEYDTLLDTLSLELERVQGTLHKSIHDPKYSGLFTGTLRRKEKNLLNLLSTVQGALPHSQLRGNPAKARLES